MLRFGRDMIANGQEPSLTVDVTGGEYKLSHYGLRADVAMPPQE
jgi:hypothetical protein